MEIDHNVYWERHFLNLCLTEGYTFFPAVIYTLSYKESNTSYGYDDNFITSAEAESFNGGTIGLSMGYLYGFNKYFAFGPDITIYSILLNVSIKNTFDVDELGEQFYYNNIGGSILFQFMIGDLMHKKIAFCFDIGGGWLASIKFGCYIKGFTAKIGYNLSAAFPDTHGNFWEGKEIRYFPFPFAHNIALDLGYTFNWAGSINELIYSFIYKINGSWKT